MPIIRRFTLLLVIILMLAGCRSHKETTHTQQTDSTLIVPQDTTANKPTVIKPSKPAYTPHYYTANFTCNAQGYSANGQMRLQNDSIIWISASKVIELGRARFTPDSVIIYAKIMNRCFRGTYADMHQQFHYLTTFKQLYSRVTAPDAEKQLATLFSRFGIEAEIKLSPMKEVGQLTFPLAIPDNAKPF